MPIVPPASRDWARVTLQCVYHPCALAWLRDRDEMSHLLTTNANDVFLIRIWLKLLDPTSQGRPSVEQLDVLVAPLVLVHCISAGILVSNCLVSGIVSCVVEKSKKLIDPH